MAKGLFVLFLAACVCALFSCTYVVSQIREEPSRQTPPRFAVLVEWGGGAERLEWEGSFFVEGGTIGRVEPYGFDPHSEPPDLLDRAGQAFFATTEGWSSGLCIWGWGDDEARIGIDVGQETFALSLEELRQEGKVDFETGDGKGAISFRESGPRRCKAILPSVIEIDEPFWVELKVVDAFGYAVATPCRVFLSSLDGAMEGLPPFVDFEPWNGGRLTLEGLRAGASGMFRVKAESQELPHGATSNPMILSSEVSQRILWADLHGQTAFSEGSGSPEDLFSYARNQAVLDVCAIADSSDFPDLLTQEEWRRISEAVEYFYEPGRFVTFLGFTWGSDAFEAAEGAGFGHRGVFFREGTWIDRIPSPALVSTPDLCSTPAALFEALLSFKDGALTIPFHPAYPSSVYACGMDWDCYNPQTDKLVEIYSKHGTSEAPGSSSPLLQTDVERTVQAALARGYRFGFCAGGSDRNGEPGTNTKSILPYARTGLTAIWADELTREAVWDALQSRHCYATDGARIFIRFQCGDAMMGDELTLTSPPVFIVHVAGTAPLKMVELIRFQKGYEVIHREKGRGEALSFMWSDESWQKKPGLCLYYLRVTQEDGHRAWASPIWID